MDSQRFPGQVEVIYFTLAHVRSLTSAARSDVFWSFAADEPMSASDIAHALGKSPSSVHYHIGELVKSGLILDVDSRRKGARTERLYVHAALEFFSMPTKDKEYRDEVSRGFNAITRQMARERAMALETIGRVPDSGLVSLFQRTSLRLSPEGAQVVFRRLQEFYRELLTYDEGEGNRFHISIHMNPNTQTSRSVYESVHGTEIDCIDPDHVEE